ncbi:MAG: MFS transporter [Candidatus Bipolaricaulota bacterium]
MPKPSCTQQSAANPHSVPHAPVGRTRLQPLFIIAAAYVAVGANIQGFRALFPAVLQDFTISRGEAGLYTSFFFLSATGAALLAGRAIDRLGAKSGLLLGVGCVGLLMALHAIAPWYGLLLALAFAAGAGFSVITPAVNLGVMEAVTSGRRALYMGVAHSGGAVGGFVGAILLPVVGSALGWRGAVMVSGAFALLMGLTIQLFYHGGKRQVSADLPDQPKLSEVLLGVVKDKRLLRVGMFGLCLGMTMSAVSTHFALFLHQDLGLSETWAGLGLAALLLGGIVGPPGWGWVSDALLGGDRRRGLSLLGVGAAMMCLVFGLLVGSVQLPLVLLLILAVVLGFVTFSGPGLYFTTVSEMAPTGRTGVTSGLALIFARVGIMLSPPLFGALADLTDTYQASWLALAAVALSFTGLYRFLSRSESRKGASPL